MLGPLTINWPLSTATGYGIYGIQIMLQYLKRGGREVTLTDHVLPPIDLPPGQDRMIASLLPEALRGADFLDRNPGEVLCFDHPVLHGVGNSFSFFKNQLRVKGRPNVGCAALEEPHCPPDWLPFLKIYDMFIAISRWNANYLAGLNIAPVHLCHQGIDTSLFYPAPRSNRWPGRFVIFSGGKFEFRKGQDIVLAAFKRFHARHPEALLVASWQNARAADVAGFALAGHCASVPESVAPERGIKVAAWLVQQGLPPENFVDLPLMPNRMMPDIMRACDVAIFPNRCEGGTNLVAMEAMACGVPTYVAANTGHRDLIEDLGIGAFSRQKPVKAPSDVLSVEGWGETDPDEVVDILENVYTRNAEIRAQAMAGAEKMKAWDWSSQNDKLLNYVFENRN